MKNGQVYTVLNNGMQMPLLGLGAWDMYGKEAEQATLDALEIGYRLIDTATLYKNEKEIGNAVRRSDIARSEIFVTTKVANTQQGYDATLKAFDASMKALNIDYINLYLVHWPVKGKRKETWKALEYLHNSKQVNAIGVANYLMPFLKELETYSAIVPVVDQMEFSPWLFLKNELQYCNDHNIQLQSYSPLTRGQKFNDEQLQKLCKKYNKTPAQIILRWNIEHGVSTIPKSSNRKRLQENFDIFDFSLSKEDVELMDGFNENFRVVEESDGNVLNLASLFYLKRHTHKQDKLDETNFYFYANALNICFPKSFLKLRLSNYGLLEFESFLSEAHYFQMHPLLRFARYMICELLKIYLQATCLPHF